MPSFDIVSEIDFQEVDNAVNQAEKEVSYRFDFKGLNPKFEFDRNKKTIILKADNEGKIDDMISVLQSKAIKRNLDIKALKVDKIIPAGGKTFRTTITLVEGIDKEIAKKITKHIKNLKMKVQPAIQDDKIRVTGKKIDDLQETIQILKQENFDLPLQFTNFRD